MNAYLRTVLLESLTVAWLLFSCPLIYGQQSQPPPTPATEDAEKKEKVRAAKEAARKRLPLFDDGVSGYVDDAVIGTRIRLRFDAAYGNDRPDRAELFYAKCGCYRELGLDPAAPGPAPRLAGRDPAVTPFIETNLDYQEFSLDLEYAPSERFSVFAELPVRSIDPAVNADASGLGDVRLGFKRALLLAPGRALTFQLRAYLPTGEAVRGLGTDHTSLEPGLLYFEALSERATLQAELRYWRPIDGSSGDPRTVLPEDDFAGDVVRYGVALGYDVTPRWTPVAELVGWTILDGLQSVSTDGTLDGFRPQLADAGSTAILNLKLGARVALAGQGSLYFGYGLALTDQDWYDDIVRLEYRRAF